MKKTRMIVAGHICMDFTPPFVCPPCRKIDEVLSPGKLVRVGAAELHAGGVVANTGLAMQRLGGDVELIAKVGDDAFGRMIRDALAGSGTADGIVVAPECSTSYTTVLAVPGIDRIFLNNPGANDSFAPDDIDFDRCDGAALFHFGYPTVMAGMYRNGGSALTEIFRRAKAHGCLTSLDMAAMDENSEAATADWHAILRRTLPYVDFFMPSIEEMLFLLNRNGYRDLQRRAAGRDATEVLSLDADVVPVAEELLSMGCRVVILKCGKAGFYYRTACHGAFEAAERSSGIDFTDFAGQAGFEPSFVPEQVVSGTGAGDTMIAAFLTAMVQGYSFARCRKLAAATGACCVTAPDALSGLRSFEELEQKIRAGWKQNGASEYRR